jgi:hypothetical protein
MHMHMHMGDDDVIFINQVLYAWNISTRIFHDPGHHIQRDSGSCLDMSITQFTYKTDGVWCAVVCSVV